GGIRLYASDFTGPVLITGNTISNSYNGIAVKDGYGSLSPAQQEWIQIRNNDLSGNVCGVYMPANGSDYLDAEENWWGDPAGPTLRNGVGVTAHVLFDPWYADAAMTTMDSNSYIAGHSYTFTVNSPNSEDGAKAYIWGFYTNNANAWVNTTYGSALIQNGQTEITYTVPTDYKSDFYWEVVVAQSPTNQTRSTLWNPEGPWDQFDTYMLRGQTLSLEAYRFDNFTMDLNTASFKMVNNIGTYPQGDVEATVEVLQPWQGDISEYDNSLYNNTTLYRKIGFYPTYATDRGYTVEVVASNPGSPQFQQIHITKPSIGYDVTLFGFRNTTTNDALGYMWWTTFPNAPLTSMDMTYDPITGTASGSFATPLSYNIPYFIQPVAEMDDPATDYVFYYQGGSMDMLLAGGVITPIHNVTQSTYFGTIQSAIDAAINNDVITIEGGVYNEALNIEGKNNLTLTGLGTGDDLTIIKPTTVIDWNAFGYTSGRKAAIRVMNSDNLAITGITLDCELIKNNGYFGVLNGNSTGGTYTNCVFKNMYNDIDHYYDVMVAVRSTEGTAEQRQTASFSNCQFIDTGRLGILSHDYVHVNINGCSFYKTTDAFGYGMEIGSQSTATVTNNTLYGFLKPAGSDNSTSGAIYIENCFTTAVTTPVSKPVTISNNNIYNNQSAITVGNQFNDYGGNVDIVATIANNTITNNRDYGILLTDFDRDNGSSVTGTLTNNVITTTLDIPEAAGIVVYAVGDGDLNATIHGNTVTGYQYALQVDELGTPAGSSFVVSATGNNFSDAEYGIYNGAVNWAILRVDNPLYTGNTLANNTIHFYLNGSTQQETEAIVEENTIVGAYYADGPVVYGSAAEMLYVDAPNQLLQGNEMQVYSVKALSIEGLRGFTTQIKVPKAYFTEPTNFTIGTAFTTYPDGYFFMPMLVDDANYWIYDVSGSYQGGAPGIVGSDVVLFTFEATSLTLDNTPNGCLIELPLANIELRDDQDPYEEIACIAAGDKLVIIDSTIPTMVAFTEPQGQTLAIDP
ncbi:MAG TPA: right-handed parallel beta-helix repeat-containing protein, partial [Candidatus Cloacimonadota bacterium]|nr:right-handed parallel beta-helix repeat-containing protein [Candidatus Cloacimonadota bacterium]